MSSAHLFPFSTVPFRSVKKVQFSVWNPEELKGYSVTQKIVQKNSRPIPAGVTSYESVREGEKVVGGLADPRMGDLFEPEHPGYFGHIELARPVYHVGFLNTVLAILRCVSFYDGRLLFEEADDSVKWKQLQLLKGKNKLGALVRLSARYTTCKRSKNPLPKYRKEGLKILMSFDHVKDHEEALIPGTGERKQTLSAAAALDILKKIPDEECYKLGLNPKWARPDWLVVTVLPVPPPHVRPSVSMGGTARCEDDLTHKLSDIVKANLAVLYAEKNGDAEHVMEQYVALLQYHVATFVDNQLPYQPQASQRSGKPLKTLRQRLVGKEGRVRGNLMGKRVDFSARTVITADPNLSIDQVGVPLSIALNLTVPERVTSFNIDRLRTLIRNGPAQHPGARYIVRDDGVRMDLRYMSEEEITLKRGWIVERHLANDDVVLFNRQPSLHKMSIMGHRVRVMYWSTFRMNLSCTSPYNADFDGDEMNLHVPQSLTARAEAETMMMVNKVIVSPQSNRPVMGIVQDSLLASWRMTRRDIFLNQNEFFNQLMWVESFNGDIPIPAIMVPLKHKPGQYHAVWTGKQLFSMIIPRGINLKLKSSKGFPRELNPEDETVLILDGEIITGIIDKGTLGAKAGGLIHLCFNEFGAEVTRVLMNQIQKITNHFILHFGFTVGVADTIADDSTLEQVRDLLENAKVQVAGLVKEGQRGELKIQPGRTMQESFEDHVNICLNEAHSKAGTHSVKSLTFENNIKATVTSGSKGNSVNISQIMAAVGQQNVEGKRIPYGFKHRTLPHFYKDDLGPESRGFVENSYLKGLSPQEFYFHAMGGREGLIDTACKTAETGYIQRRLVKALEDAVVRYDGTVRNGRGDIIQFLYGEDGMDGAFVETQKLNLLGYSKAQLDEIFCYHPNDLNFGYHRGKPYLLPHVKAKIQNDPKTIGILRQEADKIFADQQLLRKIMYEREPGGSMATNEEVVLPVNLSRLIWNAQMTYKIDMNKTSDLDPTYIITEVYNLISRLVVVDGEDRLSKEAQENATTLFKVLLRSTLASKVVLIRHRLNKEAFDSIISQIESRFYKSLANAGEMCGVLAAQSIGEPATQMTLNTFHYAGVSAKNVTLGVPRLKEIINGAKNVKTPSITIYLQREYSHNKDAASAIMGRLEYTRLRELAVETHIIFDPNIQHTIVNEDYDFVQAYWEMPDDEAITPNRLSPWLLRIVAEKKVMRFKNITNAEIVMAIKNEFQDTLFCISNDENEEKCVIRIRLIRNNQEAVKTDDEGGLEGGSGTESNLIFGVEEFKFLRNLEADLLDNMRLRGVPGIRKVYIREEDKVEQWNNETGAKQKYAEWMLETDGSNLLAVLAQPGVDYTRTVSNDCIEIWATLGVEALRRSLLNEIRAVISFDNSYVNYRHLSILVDVMAHRGELAPVTRHGINRQESGPLQRSSFEETVEILMDAAAFAELDPLSSVSENILVGQLAPIGTGHFELYLNEDMLKDAIELFSEEDEDGMIDMRAEIGAPGSGPQSPSAHSMASPQMTPSYSQFSPAAGDGAAFSPGPGMGPASPGAPFSPSSPSYQPMSPSYQVVSSPSYGAGGRENDYSPSSPAYSPSSPAYSPSSPAYSPSSPAYSPSSPAYSPSSPAYSPSSPAYSPSSPAYSPSSPAYSPSSPAYSPSSPAYSPSSPAYSPSSPAYSPSSPAYSPSSPAYSPSSPAYSPSSPAYSPSSPAYSPSSPAYSPSSPAYSPSSPAYSPSSPAYDNSGDRNRKK